MQEEKVRISRMLGMVQDETLIQRVLEFAMSVSIFIINYSVLQYINPIMAASHKKDIGKRSTLFALGTGISIRIIKTDQAPLLLEMDLSKELR